MSYKDTPLLERITPEPWVNDGGLVNGRERKDPSKPSFDLFDAATMPGDMNEMFSNADIIAAAPAMYKALLHAKKMIDEALPKFNWGDSFLNANAIKLLNEAPISVGKALAQAEGRNGN